MNGKTHLWEHDQSQKNFPFHRIPPRQSPPLDVISGMILLLKACSVHEDGVYQVSGWSYWRGVFFLDGQTNDPAKVDKEEKRN